MQDRKQMMAAFAKQLRELDRKIEELETRFLNEETPARWDEYKKFFELKKQRDAAAARLEKVKNSPPESWEEVKEELQQIMGDLRSSYFRFLFPGDEESSGNTY